jgi:predicted nucleotidyltransferase
MIEAMRQSWTDARLDDLNQRVDLTADPAPDPGRDQRAATALFDAMQDGGFDFDLDAVDRLNAPILGAVSAELSVLLAKAALNERERRVLTRLLARLRSELGDDLLAIWLYGSRARGEADPSEADPDRRSDIDLMVILGPGRDAGEFRWEVAPLVNEAADAEGDSPVYYSVQIYDSERLRNRREIRSFFFQEVDRDKLVLAGSALEDVRGSEEAAP